MGRVRVGPSYFVVLSTLPSYAVRPLGLGGLPYPVGLTSSGEVYIGSETTGRLNCLPGSGLTLTGGYPVLQGFRP